MFLKKSTNRKTGRSYLSIVKSYYDAETKQSRTATIRSIGYLDELEKQYDDPIAYFTEEVKRMNEQKAADNLPISFSIGKEESYWFY